MVFDPPVQRPAPTSPSPDPAGGQSTGGVGSGGSGGGGSGSGSPSDIRLKHDIARLGTLDNGLGFYRFAYIGDKMAYVGVMAQEVEQVDADAVTRGPDGYLRVYYDRLGFPMQTYDDWLAAGARLPAAPQRR